MNEKDRSTVFDVVSRMIHSHENGFHDNSSDGPVIGACGHCRGPVCLRTMRCRCCHATAEIPVLKMLDRRKKERKP